MNYQTPEPSLEPPCGPDPKIKKTYDITIHVNYVEELNEQELEEYMDWIGKTYGKHTQFEIIEVKDE